MVADNLDGVLVRADGAVSAETPELAGDRACGSGVGAVLFLFLYHYIVFVPVCQVQAANILHPVCFACFGCL